ncbi:MAG: LysR family transcriptional regulator, partial [Burkholderiales bacterium]|nr:LysR family transcriptional regulator [Burkholderiales bacterium]
SHALAHFELDLALIEGENHHPDLIADPWLQDEMCIVAASTHPLAKQTELAISSLSNETWVLREPMSGNREQFEQLIQPHLKSCQLGLELNTLEAVMLAVEQGLGITFISRLAAQDKLSSGKLVSLPMQQRFPRQLYLAWHRQKYHSSALRRFIQFCRDQAEVIC